MTTIDQNQAQPSSRWLAASVRACTLLLSVLVICIAIPSGYTFAEEQQQAASTSTADHTKFEVLQGSFDSGPAVTKACLSCHTEASKQLMDTTHWTWSFDHPTTGQTLGKATVTNSYCGSVVTNEPRCTSCHIGYGWTDMTVPASQALTEHQVDCLVCHDTTGGYKKFPTKAGHPAYEPAKWQGKLLQPPDLTEIARNVGPTSRETCGVCHFYGGGGNGVKHGDMDSSLNDPPLSLDVHMSSDGADMTCATCHNPDAHDLPGSRYAVNARDVDGIDVPSGRYESHASCESCHGTAPHDTAFMSDGAKLNDHVDTVACQTCHIPEYARGGVATMMWWDWSTAGRMGEDGKPMVIKDDLGHPAYATKKGSFRYGENVVPTYAWFDGQIEYTLITDPIDDTAIVPVNRFSGGPDNPQSRIWPFKVMEGKQPYDTQNKTLLVSHLFGKDDAAYWKHFDWQKALTFATDKAGLDYSGEFDFIQTTMHWPITHMVAPAEESLACVSCHVSSGGRLEGLDGVYLPGRDSNSWVQTIGWGLVALTFLGVLIHALGRVLGTVRNRA